MRNVKSDPSRESLLSWKPAISDSLNRLVPYPAGKPIEETERELGIKGVIKLASNENPLGASPMSLNALASEMTQVHRYPDAGHYRLKHKLAQFYGVGVDNIAVGNGSNEIIDLLIRAYAQTHDNVVGYKTAFVAYKLCSQLQGCHFKEAPVDKSLNLSIDDLLAQVDERTKLVFLANPNNPTGSFINRAEVLRLAQELDRRQVLLVLDCAYEEYVTDDDLPTGLEIWRQCPNVIVLKTFSKIYGLAAFRVGYAIANEVIITTLAKARQPFNLNSFGLKAAEVALDDFNHVKQSLQCNQDGMRQLLDGFKPYNVRALPSQGNFILFDMGQPAAPLYQEFLNRGVILRPVGNYGLPNHLRITIGLPQENETLLKVASNILK